MKVHLERLHPRNGNQLNPLLSQGNNHKVTNVETKKWKEIRRCLTLNELYESIASVFEVNPFCIVNVRNKKTKELVLGLPLPMDILFQVMNGVECLKYNFYVSDTHRTDKKDESPIDFSQYITRHTNTFEQFNQNNIYNLFAGEYGVAVIAIPITVAIIAVSLALPEILATFEKILATFENVLRAILATFQNVAILATILALAAMLAQTFTNRNNA